MGIHKGSNVKITQGDYIGCTGTVERTPLKTSSDKTLYYVRLDDGLLLMVPDTYVTKVEK